MRTVGRGALRLDEIDEPGRQPKPGKLLERGQFEALHDETLARKVAQLVEQQLMERQPDAREMRGVLELGDHQKRMPADDLKQVVQT